MRQKRKMKSHLQKRKFQLMDKKQGLLQFKKSIAKIGLLKTIKGKMRKFLRRAQSKAIEVISQPERELGDFKDFLEEFLISGDFKISSNKFLVNYLRQDDRNLDILMNFITHPFSYSVRL